MSSAAPQRPSRTPAALWVLYTDTFTMAVGFYMLVPLLAIHLVDDVGIAVAVVGLLAGVRSFCQHGLMPLSGWIADRIDYRWAICAGVLVRAVGFALLGTAGSVTALAVASVLTGLGGSLFHPASYAAYAALSDGLDTVKVYSTRELLSNLGFVVGPVIGSAVAGLDFRWVSLTAAGLFLLAFVVTLVGLPGGLSGAPGTSPSMRTVLADRGFVRYCVLAGALWLLVSQLYLVVPLQASSVLPSAIGVGLLYSGSAVLMVATMLPLTRFVSARAGKGTILAGGAVCLAAGICVMGAWGTLPGLLVGMGLFTVGQMVTQPVMSSVVADFATPGATASYFGVQGVAQAVGGVVGSVGGGLLYALAESQGLVALTPWVAFAVWGSVCALFLTRRGVVP